MGFGQFMRILRARLGMILVVTVLGLAVGVGLALTLPKRYDATASVIIDPKADVLPGGVQGLPERVDNAISTNLDILASPNVALKVVDALGLEEKVQAGELLAAGPLQRVRDWVSDAMERVFGDDPAEDKPVSVKEALADGLIKNVKLNTTRDSRVIRVSYSSPDPQFSAAAANAFVRAYRATLLELQVGPAKENTEWLETQTRELKQDLEAAEAKLAKFQQEKGIVASDERLDVETSKLTELAGQLAMAQSLSYESQARQRQLRGYLKGGGDAPAEVAGTPLIQQLRNSVAERESKLSELSKRVGPNHPQYQAAATDLDKMRGELKEATQSAARSALESSAVQPQREGSLHGALNAQRSRVLKMKVDRNELAAMMREVDNAQKAYSAVAQRMSQTRMESQLSQTNGSIVTAATVPRRPASPNIQLLLARALAGGVFAGVGLALYSETVNRVVRSEYDITDVLGLPVLAVLLP